MHVGFQSFALGTGPLVGQHVGRIHDVVEHVIGDRLAVVALDGVDDLGRLTVLARQRRAGLGVRALDLLFRTAADVVQQARTPRGLHRIA